jgi:YD repeat-containing protein
MSFRYGSGIVKPGFNPLGAQTTTVLYNLFSWGRNVYGQLGLGNTTVYSSPKQVGSLTNWSVISAAGELTTAIKTDGTLWSWGYNSQGQLGINTTNSISSPQQVGSLTTWSNLGWSKAYVGISAIKTDGTLWTWGINNVGNLGLGDDVFRSSPVQVGALTNWLRTSGAYGSFVAVKTDGTLWTWGWNTSGQLGTGNVIARSSPVQVGALTNWLQVAGCYNACAAIKTDGTLWAWGINGNGELGINDGITTRTSSPVQIPGTTWCAVAARGNAAYGIKSDNTLWAWGSGRATGMYCAGDQSSPIQIPGTTWISVNAGQEHTLARKI